jgi:hypothetical protein
MGIDAAGYCTQCRTYRGVPQTAPPPSYPQSYDLMPPAGAAQGGTVYGGPTSGPPSSGAPYSGPPQYGAPYGGPTSGAPYTGGPASGPPYGGGPASGPPYSTPTSGAPYPTAYPPGTYGGSTTSRGRPSFLVPLLAATGTLVILAVAIVIVALAKSNGDKGGGTAGGHTPSASSLVDTCVVGDWTETSHDESTPIDGFVGKVQFSGKGALLHLKSDGTGSYEYKSATYTGTGERAADNQSYEIKLQVTGSITFEYRTDNSTFSFRNMKATGSAVAFLNGTQVPGSQPLEPDTNPATYTCNGDSMKHTNSVYTINWKRG